jgi:hypothetical protein
MSLTVVFGFTFCVGYYNREVFFFFGFVMMIKLYICIDILCNDITYAVFHHMTRDHHLRFRLDKNTCLDAHTTAKRVTGA